MPIESIQTPKAPRGWSLTPDQEQQVSQDPRLQRLSRDDLYFYFNQPKEEMAPKRAQPAPQRRSTAPMSGGLGGVFNTVTKALRGR